MMTFRKIALGAIFALIVAQTQMLCLGADDPMASRAEGATRQKKVIDGIRENYRRLPVVHCQLLCTTLDSRVKERKVVTGTTDRGAAFELIMEPRFVTETDLVLSERSLRAESRTKGGGNEATHTLHKGIWTSFSPARSQAARWYRSDISGVMNCDPRNLGAAEQRGEFLDEFAADRVLRFETATSSGEERLVLHMERTLDDGGTSRYRAEFDSERSFLPRRFVHYDSTSSGIISVLDIELQKIEAQSAWFLKKSVQRFYAEKSAETPDQKECTQQITTEVVGIPRTDETFSDSAFEIAIAPGIRLRDHTRGRDPPPEDAKDEIAPSESPGYAGTWVRATAIDEALGNAERKLVAPNGGGVHVSPVIEIVVDETPNERTIALSKSWIDAVGHAPIKHTGQILFREADKKSDPEDANICAFTHHEGNTYVWFAVPNLGMLPLRLSAIAGASEKQDLLFIEWMPDDRFPAVNRAVTAYRRLAKEEPRALKEKQE